MNHTSEQREIIEYQDSSFRVLAGAGSGKTTTMAEFVKREIQCRKTKPEEIAFITFTRFAAEEIKRKVKKIVGRHLPILCGTFHSAMWKLLKQAKIESPKPKLLYDARLAEWVNFVLQQMKERNQNLVGILFKYKCLIVDEFQDLDEFQFEFIKVFKEICPEIRIIAIGDLAQNIYRFRGTSNEFLRTRLKLEIDSQLKTFRLTTNFRSSKQILNAANLLFEEEIKNKKILPMYPSSNAIEGQKPEYYEFAVNPGKGYGEYEEYVVNTLLPVIKDAKKNGKSIVLIFPMLKVQSFQLISALLRYKSRENGYSFDIHEISKEDETCATVEFKYNPRDKDSPIQCSTFHSAKGLEWDIVALINITDDMYRAFNDEEDDEAFITEKTNLFYVGVTRPMERLLIFANANMGGRHRHFARLGDKINDIFQCTWWGNEIKDPSDPKIKPIGVRELIRKLPQHPDLYEKIKKSTENIPSYAMDGNTMVQERTYNQMKLRNRELAFGTYIDWKLKQILCTGERKTLQDALIELSSLMNKNNWFHKEESIEDIDLRLAKLNVFFLNANQKPRDDMLTYVTASRYLALHDARMYSFVDCYKNIYYEIKKLFESILAKNIKTISDEYILSQMKEFFIKGYTKEIQAVSAPQDSYQGLPYDVDSFVQYNTTQMINSIKDCLSILGLQCDNIRGDVPLESVSLIMGEADLVHADDVILEVKCNASSKAIDLRDNGECKNLLQLLTYVALGRYGTMPLKCKWAVLVNPLTGAWERYDIREWKEEDSRIFMDCLEELRERV